VNGLPWRVEDFEIHGERPVRRFLAKLPEPARVEAFALIQLLAERGNALRRPHSGALGQGLFELRGVRSGVRIFYAFLPGRRIALLDGVVKKQDRIPRAVLAKARRYQNLLLSREGHE